MILVTGASGLVGSRLIEETGIPIFPVTRTVVDLAEPFTFRKFPKKIDAVVHLAQSRYFKDFPNSADDIFAVNTGSTQRLLEYARKAGARLFVYASTGGVYGGESPVPYLENRPVWKWCDFYTNTKIFSEGLVSSYRPYFRTVILRPFFIYGSGQKPNMLIPRLINTVENGSEVTLNGNNGLIINPIYVDDAVRAIIKIIDMETPPPVINLAGPERVPLRQLCNHIGDLVGRYPNFKVTGTHSTMLVGDITILSSFCSPKVYPEEGLRRMIKT